MSLRGDLGNRKLPCGTRQKKQGCMQKGSRPNFLSSALHFLKMTQLFYWKKLVKKKKYLQLLHKCSAEKRATSPVVFLPTTAQQWEKKHLLKDFFKYALQPQTFLDFTWQW